MNERSHGRIGKCSSMSRQMPADQWLAENFEAQQSSNAFVEAHGVPLASYRTNAPSLRRDAELEDEAARSGDAPAARFK